MNLKNKILQQIMWDIVVKIVPSKIPNAGVGVIPLTSIEKGEIVFKPKINVFISWEELSSIENGIFEHIKKTCNNNQYGFWVDCPINDIHAAYFVNHSEDPNLYHDLEADVYYAIKNIPKGEELTCKYLPEEIDWV